MATGILIGATDIDSIFEPKQAGDTSASATSIIVGGVDLNTRYPARSMGTVNAAATSILVGASDLNTIFAKIGDVNRSVESVSFTAQNFTANDMSQTLAFYTNGTWQLYEPGPAVLNSGTWLTAGSAANVKIQAIQTAISTGGPNVTNQLNSSVAITATKLVQIDHSFTLPHVQYFQFTLEFRKVSDNSLLLSVTLNRVNAVDV